MNQETPLRLLIIEDVEDDLILLLRLLRRSGYQLVYERVEDESSMREQLNVGEWDLIISDYSLPQFDGMSALNILKESHLDIPFIIVSGTIGEETAVKAMKAGAHDYLMKNKLDRLVPAIERELREAEERRNLRQAEANIKLLSSALAQSASLVIITNPNGIIEYVNQTLTQVTGFDADELVGQSWQHLQASQSSQIKLDSLRENILEEGQWRGELKFGIKTNDYFWASVSVSVVRDNNNHISQLVMVAEDISERKRLEVELQRYNEQLEEMVEERTNQLRHAKEEIEVILNATSDAIALTLPNGDIQKINPAFKRIFGDQVDQAIESLLWYLSDNEYIETVGEAFLSVIYDQTDQRIEAPFFTIDKQLVDTDMVFVPAAYSAEDKSGIVLSLRDISHFKEVERFKSQFVANATHDLSSPISAMKTRLYLLQRTPERLVEHVNILETQISRLEHLVGELRILSELDHGKASLDLQLCNLNKLIEQVIETYKPNAQEKDQIIIWQPDIDLPELMIDKLKIERVIVNLIANALIYTPNNRKIIVTTVHTHDYVEFTVHDQGMGIAEDSLPKIFERFFRTDRARGDNTDGTGLGLAISKEMVELHKGTISVTSKLNEGTTFSVQFPRSL